MPGETANIAAMAEEVSGRIFSRFGWEKPGPTNENFECVKIKKHQKKKSPTHPVDVVFSYDDPYFKLRNYILTDLKSYATGSIKVESIKFAMINLSKAVYCANISREWQRRYVNEELNWKVSGMLFIYNHDARFDKAFNRFFPDTRTTSSHLPSNSNIYVIGPDRISYMLNVLNDIDGERGRGVLPPSNRIEFWYPDLVNQRPLAPTYSMAPIELLMGPWQVLRYEKAENQIIKKGIYFYYAGTGKSSKEFEFIMDFAFKNQLVQKNCTISIRCPNAEPNARQNFEQAQDNIFRNFYSLPEIRERLNQFKFNPVELVVTRFSTTEIGMEARNGKIL